MSWLSPATGQEITAVCVIPDNMPLSVRSEKVTDSDIWQGLGSIFDWSGLSKENICKSALYAQIQGTASFHLIHLFVHKESTLGAVSREFFVVFVGGVSSQMCLPTHLAHSCRFSYKLYSVEISSCWAKNRGWKLGHHSVGASFAQCVVINKEIAVWSGCTLGVWQEEEREVRRANIEIFTGC